MRPASSRRDTTGPTSFRGFGKGTGILGPSTRISLLGGSFRLRAVGKQSAGLGLTVNGQSDLDRFGERRRELTHFGILSLQEQAGSSDVQTSLFTLYRSLSFTAVPLGDLLFNGVAPRAARSSWANGT